MVRRETGFMADPARREALSMAIDRTALIQSFGLSGWRDSSWVVPPDIYSAPPYGNDRWNGASIEERRRVEWRQFHDGELLGEFTVASLQACDVRRRHDGNDALPGFLAREAATMNVQAPIFLARAGWLPGG